MSAQWKSRQEKAVIRPHTDHQLVAAIAAGNRAALEPLYDKFSRPVFALLMRIVRDRPTAEDLLQEVFASAWQHADRFDPGRGDVLPWLLGIGHHAALNELRRRRRRPHVVQDLNSERVDDPIALIADPNPTPDEDAWFALRRRDLRGALLHLSDADRTVVELFAIGHSQSEIAALLQAPLGTVKTRMRRGLQQLRAAAERHEFEWD